MRELITQDGARFNLEEFAGAGEVIILATDTDRLEGVRVRREGAGVVVEQVAACTTCRGSLTAHGQRCSECHRVR